MTRSLNKRNFLSPGVFKAFFALLCAVVLTGQSALAQDYELMLNQRRMGDQIGVEVWAKTLTSNAPRLGNMTISLEYNDVFLKPSNIESANGLYTGNPASVTDSIYYDMNVAQPYVTIESPFGDPNNGYDFLAAQAVEVNDGGSVGRVFTLQALLQNGGNGYQPQMSGKGSLVGVLKFDIIQPEMTELSDAELTQINFNTTYSFAPTTVITDYLGNDVTSKVTYANTPDFAIRDIAILSPNNPSSAIRRYVDPALASVAPNHGYPIYFERSGLLKDMDTYGTYGTNTLAYQVALSLQGGADGTWAEVGRFAETPLDANSMSGNNDYYVSGEISRLSQTKPYYVTQGNGNPLPNAAARPEKGYGGILRFVWADNENYAFRSEEAVLKISQLEADDVDHTVTNAAINERDVLTDVGRWDITDHHFTLGRMFFAQLDGVNDYFRTVENISTPTEITVGCWINLNSSAQEDAEPAIIVSGNSTSGNEGPWMLYLTNGVYPAFRAHLKDENGPGKELARVVSPNPLGTIGDISPIVYEHGNNWVHVAATVKEGTVILYMNGEVVAQKTNEELNLPRMYDMQFPIYVGVNPNNGGLNKTENYINAGIKEVKFWRTALTQDQIRSYIAGVYEPSNVVLNAADKRKELELYFPLQADRKDYATERKLQWGDQELNFYNGGTAPANDEINFRPDRAHVVLTSPIGGEGVSNLKGDNFEVRWAGFGLGSVNPNTSDLQIMISRDNGVSWFDAIGPDASPALPLDQVEIEDGSALWSPYNNKTISDYDNDLQSVVAIENNYAKDVILRISGTEADGLDGIYYQSGAFTVAPHFALSNNGNARVEVAANRDLSLTGNTNMIEAWIKPYRFPTETEGSFPIFTKKLNDNLHYAFRLMSDGQLALSVYDTTTKATLTAYSGIDNKVVAPDTEASDSTWTHVVAWVNLADGGNSTQVRFYVDGATKTDAESTGQFGSNVSVDRNNNYPVYIGYEPFGTNYEDGTYFIGELKEVRFWAGNPGDVELLSVEPSDLTMFIQGAQGVRANELTTFAGVDYSENLVAAWTFDGGSWINGGIQNSVAVYPKTNNEDLIAVVYGSGFKYEATEPFIKIVEPSYKQNVSNQEHDLRVRWVGWDYDRNDGDAPFRNGSDATNMADLDFSVGGGGGPMIQPYQPVASQAYNDSYRNAMMFNYLDKAYEFLGTGSRTQYAADLDMAYTDPDMNDDYTYSDQGAITASQVNGRFKLIGRSTINGSELTYDNAEDGYVEHLLAESDLFNITPPSNFTVRVLLEGYHTGTDATTGGIQNDIGQTFDGKGLSIKLYENQANQPGLFVAESVSKDGYFDSDARQIKNRNAGDNSFGNVPYVFTELKDGRYFVTVDHINHLPITSAYAAPFVYTGDDQETWDIESGWDFTGWNGVKGNELTQNDAMAVPPLMGDKYAARGPSETDPNEGAYASKQLIYNNGRAGGQTTGMISAMVGGDVRRDGTIDASDRVDVNSGVAGTAAAADVTGDGFVNADDRIIVYRNAGITTAGGDHPAGAVVLKDDVAPIAAPLYMADFHNVNNAKVAEMVRAEQYYYENGGTNADRISPKYNIEARLQGKGGISYEVSAVAKKVDQFIDVEVFVKNTGDVWAMGNSTFGLEYDETALQFDSYIGTGNVIFNGLEYGYNSPYSNPAVETPHPITGLRTIDIVHAQDAKGNLDGVEVPFENTSLGTLRFRINRTADYMFQWHRITTVHDVDGLSITDNGDFKYIDPILIDKSVEITYPLAGDRLEANRAYNVTWTEPEADDMMIDLLFSSNGGDSWEVITPNPIAIGERSYYWVAPNVNSSECKIQMREVETESIIDETSHYFSVLAAPIDITEPCTYCGTLFSGNTSSIVWTTDQNIQVYFEYSENGLNNWEKVTDVVSSTLLSTSWIVPEANTSTAVIRMVNMEGEVLALSTPFKILSGNLTIDLNSQFQKVGKEAEINWSYYNVEKFDIEFSKDGGKTWGLIADDVYAADNLLMWLVPDAPTEEAVIRAIYNNNPELEYSRVKFQIEGKGSAVNDPAALGYTLSSAIPNPFAERSEMTFTLPVMENVTAELYDISGNKVSTIIDGQVYGAGTHTFAIDATNIATGTYIVYVTVGEYTLTQRVLIIK